MNKYFGVLFGTLLCSSASLFPLKAMDNHMCDPEHIFLETKGGKATLPQCTTNADLLHKEGIQGQRKDGKPIVVGIIDMGFYHGFTDSLKAKGVIHPASLSEKLILDSGEDLENVNLVQLYTQVRLLKNKASRRGGQDVALNDQIRNLEDRMHRKATHDFLWHNDEELTPEKRAQAEIQIFELNKKIYKYNQNKNDLQKNNKIKGIEKIKESIQMLLSGQTKDITNTYGYKYPLNAHGSAITDTIHLMAPQARLLLIDLYSISGQHLGDKNIDAVMAQAIDKAIDHGVDVINLSQNVKDTPEMVAACQRAAQKGIPIIIAAGNDSTKSNPVLISKSAGDLFNKVEGKGIRFVGALKYGKNGEEKQTSYTQLPDEKTQKHVLFAAGNNFPVRYNLADPDKLDGGTCWATAAATAGCALTIGMADMMGYQASSEELLDIMFDAGRNVNHKFTPVRALLSRPTQAPALVNVKRPYKGQSFSGKSMDLWNTKLAIEAKIAAAPKTLRALPVAPVVRNVRALPIVPR